MGLVSLGWQPIYRSKPELNLGGRDSLALVGNPSTGVNLSQINWVPREVCDQRMQAEIVECRELTIGSRVWLSMMTWIVGFVVVAYNTSH